jgi:hypothetical protein
VPDQRREALDNLAAVIIPGRATAVIDSLPTMRNEWREKLRLLSTLGQLVNAIRRKDTAISGSLIMGNFVHQQNLAHYRRLLAEAELATSGDEIRHSMLMRLLAEEEANGLLIAVDDDRARQGRPAVH